MRKHWLTCGFVHREEHVADIVYDSGVLLDLRRRALKFIMLSTYHPYAKIYFKSHLQRRREHIRHLRVSPCTIHPFSYFNMYWESIISSMYCLSGALFFVNCMYSWNSSTQVFLARLLLTMEIVYIFDSILRFFVGYYDSELNKTVLSRKYIAKHYLKTYFLVDQIPCFITYLLPLRGCKAPICLEIVKWSRLLFFPRIFRIPRIIEAYDTMKVRLLPNFHATIMKTSLILYLILLLSYSIFLVIENFIEYTYYGTKRWKQFNVFRLYTITLKLLTVCYSGTIEAGQVTMQITSFIFLTWGVYIYLVTLIWIMKLWMYHSHARLGADCLYREFQQYVQYKDLHYNLRLKCFRLFRFKFHTHYYKESTIDKTVSLILKQQIRITITRRQLEKVDFFRDVPALLLTKLIAKYKSEIFLTNDVVVIAGLPGDCMYFINFGTVAVYSTSGREICHLEDGAHIGEIALIFDVPQPATVVAVAPCELFKIKKSDYIRVLGRNPDIMALIEKRAAQSWAEYKKKAQ